MTNVKVTSTPSQEIIQKSLEEMTVVDSRGRQIILRKPTALAQLRLIKALGNDTKNEIYRGMVSTLLWVYKIDGNFVPPIQSDVAIESLWSQLDEEGLEAITKALQEKLGVNQTAEEALEEIKK